MGYVWHIRHLLDKLQYIVWSTMSQVRLVLKHGIPRETYFEGFATILFFTINMFSIQIISVQIKQYFTIETCFEALYPKWDLCRSISLRTCYNSCLEWDMLWSSSFKVKCLVNLNVHRTLDYAVFWERDCIWFKLLSKL